MLNLQKNLAIDHAGHILAILAPRPPADGVISLFRVDPVNGRRTLFADGALSEAFPPIVPLGPMAVEESDDVVLTAVGPFGVGQSREAALVRVDPITGEPTILSDRIPRDIAGVPTPVVNGLVSLSVASTVVEPATGASGAPAGMFRITATLSNVTSTSIHNPFLRVAELSMGNLLVNGDRPPVVSALSGKGPRLTPDVGSDGVLSPGESVAVELAIGLQTRAVHFLRQRLWRT
jgi:hypothetical protein